MGELFVLLDHIADRDRVYVPWGVVVANGLPTMSPSKINVKAMTSSRADARMDGRQKTGL
ncbi:MAG: hypothetical protein ACXWU5_09090 [Rhodoplanes sp.]